MNKLTNFLFPDSPGKNAESILLLLFRLVFGILFMIHGIQKWNAFEELAQSFPDPLGIGSSFSLILTIFGELVCSVAFIFGFLYRLALIPMIFTMLIAFCVIHGNDPLATKELALIYLLVFGILYVFGAGKYAIDYKIRQRFNKDN